MTATSRGSRSGMHKRSASVGKSTRALSSDAGKITHHGPEEMRQPDLFDTAQPVKARLCDCWIGNGVVHCDDADVCSAWAARYER